MDKVEQFIQDCTRNCSNELCSIQDKYGKQIISYHEWLTPDQCKVVAEIAKKDVIEKACKWLDTKDDRDYYTIGYIKNHFQELIKEIGL